MAARRKKKTRRRAAKTARSGAAPRKAREPRKKPAAAPRAARARARKRPARVRRATPRRAAPAAAQPPPPAAARLAGPFAASLQVLASRACRAGVVRHWFPRAGAALVALEEPIAVGDRLHVRGATSDFLARVGALRVAGAPAARAERGEATIALPERARPGDVLYVLRPPA